MKDIQIGDDITVEGVVKEINGSIMIETKAGTNLWINPKDIKTHRPNKKGEQDGREV